MLKDPKTTVSGLFGATALIAKAAGVDVPDEVTYGAASLAVFLIGLFAKDK